ncbi:MAG: hypothetical protein WC604_01260 [Candidatus Gracilibacteria bacterium]
MLTQEDLKNIGVELGKVIEQNITPAMDSLQNQIEHVGNQMITKDYLDDKLEEHHGNMIILMRKGDTKLLRLVELLKEKNVLNDEEAKSLLTMEPFPKLV